MKRNSAFIAAAGRGGPVPCRARERDSQRPGRLRRRAASGRRHGWQGFRGRGDAAACGWLFRLRLA